MSEKAKTGRQPMPQRDARERVGDFDEVPLGYDAAAARAEASRCLQCKKPLCVEGCPVSIRIPEFIGLIAEGRFGEAASKLKEETALPAICGRVCPQETQCEKACILGRRGQPVAIGHLERFAADYERGQGEAKAVEPAAPTGFAVAVIGAGPAGTHGRRGTGKARTPGRHIRGAPRAGRSPHVRDTRVSPAEGDRSGGGGVSESLGVEIVTDFPVGRARTLDELLSEYDAVFIGAGAGLPRFLDVPGENLVGVLSANEYLTRVNLMRAWQGAAPRPS